MSKNELIVQTMSDDSKHVRYETASSSWVILKGFLVPLMGLIAHQCLIGECEQDWTHPECVTGQGNQTHCYIDKYLTDEMWC